MKRTPLRKVSPKQSDKQADWNRLVDFLSIQSLKDGSGHFQSECCGMPQLKLDGAHIIGKTRAGCTWTAKNCLLVSRWCGCHSHQDYADGLRMSIEEALEIARKRNEKYGINPDYDGSKEMNPYLTKRKG